MLNKKKKSTTNKQNLTTKPKIKKKKKKNPQKTIYKCIRFEATNIQSWNINDF